MVGLIRRAIPSSRAPSPDAPGRGRRGHSVLGARSVVGQMFLLQVALVILLATAAVIGLGVLARVDSRQEAVNRSLAVAQGLANSPGMVEALESPRPDVLLQPLAEEARKGSGVDFVVVMSRDGTRYTHPDPSRIGERFLGTIAPARAGGVVKETYTGTLGPSARAVVPVRAPDGTVVGLVAAGITMDRIDSVVDRELPIVIAGAAVAILLATGCAALISRRLLRQTHGMGPAEITRMYEHHDAVLHSVREGVLIVDEDRRLLLANDEAARLLDLPPDAQGRRVTDLGLDPATTELLTSGREASDEVHLAGGRLLAVNHRPIDRLKGPPGTVATLRDSTELRALSGRAETARGRLRLLYDASVRIGTTLEVERTAEELVQVAVPRFADFVTVDLAEPVMHGDEPGDPGADMRRVASGGVRDDSPLYRTGELISYAEATPQTRSLAAGLPMIVPDLCTMQEWRAQDPERSRRITDYGIHSLIAAPLLARGAVLGVAGFWRREQPEPYDEDDLSLAKELAARTAVCVDNARRYTREHAMAVTLQRSLLPRGLPEQNALDVAYRYLPAKSGVGGDWFDVIPLPGARVALVVGDVVGHGLHAAATMGRLRTAVHNFSALDLPPDELLSHLDELVDRIDREATADGSGSVTGATCLYAVYDPAARTCVAARAGHLPPALVLPDGKVEFPDLPAGPPLGVGGLPFETASLEIPEGSRLVLYTDGLVESRDHDIGEGLEHLRDSLARSADDPEATCGTVLADLLPARPADDVALLVARTRALGPERSARWDVPRDPAAVRTVRAAVTERLAAWDMEDTAFLAELVLTELVTNAIRHATGPIGVRLVRDTALICEVSDGSSTSPHLRYATGTDEGGRGLFLVAQFADRWGTRYTPEGKVIWAELPLPKV